MENDLEINKVSNVSDLIGSWGPLQRKIFILLGIVYIVAPFNYLGLSYYALKDDLWCSTSNDTKVSWTIKWTMILRIDLSSNRFT